jgi:hypothetical protein
MGYASHACTDVVSAQDCFDTGQDTLLTVQTDAEDALGWVIKLEDHGSSAVWPARCGDPSLFSYGATVLSECLLVRTIGPGGQLSPKAHRTYLIDIPYDLIWSQSYKIIENRAISRTCASIGGNSQGAGAARESFRRGSSPSSDAVRVGNDGGRSWNCV